MHSPRSLHCPHRRSNLTPTIVLLTGRVANLQLHVQSSAQENHKASISNSSTVAVLAKLPKACVDLSPESSYKSYPATIHEREIQTVAWVICKSRSMFLPMCEWQGTELTREVPRAHPQSIERLAFGVHRGNRLPRSRHEYLLRSSTDSILKKNNEAQGFSCLSSSFFRRLQANAT